MKKYVWLACGTVLLAFGIVGVGAWARPTEPKVSTVTITEQTVQKHVTCVGKIENADGHEVFVEAPCVAGTVYVSEGQRVKKDEVLFSVDAEATAQVLSQLVPSLSPGEVPYTETQITAPMDGVVTMINVKPGEMADHTKPCAVIASGNGIQVTVAIRERDLPRLRVGQEAMVSGVAFVKDAYRGTIAEIAETAHQKYIGSTAETVVDAVIMFDDGEVDESLRVGLNAKAEVVVDRYEGALLVPYDCVTQTEDGEEYGYVYTADGVAQRRTLTLGEECADGVLVVSGLSSGERLVQAPEALSGTHVRVQAR